ncbi:PaaX family transcriptional regulator [Yinghuangia seranimata]|uniref:PaaX family transcriptional regulator n=1 Tax=Yinghuangia seranimata TaxID=408067 RepID=UPI00248BB97F|nr:PaaX family transcriptional regulator C-terminal domain-containing protein [Yinghuangia seranimata]MDI2129087.1 PaaX family transcriptional regulator C-terminal domain-containing protein [Yinghuangia seranimata]
MTTAPSTPSAASGPRTRRRSDGSPSARTLLLTVLGEYVGYAGTDRVWSAAVVEALRACGVEETAARRAITRLTHEGWLTTEPAGRFTRLVMTPRLVRLLASWTARLRRAMEETPWEGTWQQLLLRVPAAARTERAAVEEQLAFQGFGALGQGVWIAADAGGVPALRELLAELGLAGGATWLTCRTAGESVDGSGGFVEASAEDSGAGSGEASGGSRADLALAAQAWDLDAVRPLHTDFLERFAGVRADGDEEAFVLRTRLVHAWRLTFDRDPRLPGVLLPADWPGRAAAEVFVRTWLDCRDGADRWWARLDEDPRGAQRG